MRFSTIAAPVTLAAVVSAAPTTLSSRGYDDGNCIPYEVATAIETTWISTLTNFDAATAQNLLYPDVQDYSDSINYIAGIPLGSVTFPGAQAYIAGQGAQPPIDFTVLDTAAITCDGVIALQWVAGVGSHALPAQGITILKAIKVGNDAVVGPTGWQLKEIKTEFNSAAWIIDIGGSVTVPAPPSS